MKTKANGRKMKLKRNVSATPINSHRIQRGSVLADSGVRVEVSGNEIDMGLRTLWGSNRPALSPALETINQEENQEGDHQHGDGQRIRPPIVVLLELGND